MKLYELLMAYDYDRYSNPLKQDPKYLTVKINGEYDYLPADKEERLDHIKENWQDVTVTKVTLQPQGEGQLWALKIFTD